MPQSGVPAGGMVGSGVSVTTERHRADAVPRRVPGGEVARPLRHAAVTRDSTSSWSVTAPSTLTFVTGATVVGDAITNLLGNGFTVTYDASLAENAALAGKTYTPANGGTLAPR